MTCTCQLSDNSANSLLTVLLGYLQWEGLSSTSQIFINESPHLKEYAEHSTEDGAIPACVFVSRQLNYFEMMQQIVYVLQRYAFKSCFDDG